MDLSMKSFRRNTLQITPNKSKRTAAQRLTDENQEESLQTPYEYQTEPLQLIGNKDKNLPRMISNEYRREAAQITGGENQDSPLQIKLKENQSEVQHTNLPILREVNRTSPRKFRRGTVLDENVSSKFQNKVTSFQHSILHNEKNADKQIRLINKRFQQYETHKAALQIIYDDRSHKLAQMVLESCFSSNSKTPELQTIHVDDTVVSNDVKPFSLNNTIEEPTISSGNHSKARRSYAKQLKQEGTPTDLIPIGPNGTQVSEKLISSIDWSVVNSATRKLLMIIFDRDTLASHSLSGRPSPAFIEKTDYVVKSKLDENKINDIIHMVTTKCKASEKHVRQAITIKLADEQKMKRQRDERASMVDQRPKKIQKK